MAAVWDVVVIGAGVTGLTAARRTASAGLKTACIEALMFGGLIVNVNHLRPGLGSDDTSGVDVASELLTAATDAGATIVDATVTALELGDIFKVVSDLTSHAARAVIVASGARLRRLGVPGEEAFLNRGVSQCADCDGPMFAGKAVIVVGGGDSAVQEALVLAEMCERVVVVHRTATFSARPELVQALESCSNVTTRWNTVVERIEGTDAVEAVRVRTRDEISEEIPCNAVFPYVGLEPSTEYVPVAVPRDQSGHLNIDAGLQTALPRLFAAGAVRAGCGGTVLDAVSDGRLVADSVQRLL